jgi:putative ubiquitin-RnfH superfamily antitoxin RatB of RatAB toxin-antitoxin module
MAGADVLEVELAFNDRSETLRVPAGTTVRSVIERSRLLERHPEIDLAQNRVGIYARFVSLEALVQNGDRVEVYRPLQADPKELRRQRTRV